MTDDVSALRPRMETLSPVADPVPVSQRAVAT
jgi:hypothetical protein